MGTFRIKLIHGAKCVAVGRMSVIPPMGAAIVINDDDLGQSGMVYDVVHYMFVAPKPVGDEEPEFYLAIGVSNPRPVAQPADAE